MDLISKYIEKNDWELHENANTAHSLSGLKGYIAGKILRQDAINKSPAGKAHINNSLYIHDLDSGIFAPYCYGADLFALIKKGIKNPFGACSNPAKHFDVLIDHLVNFLYTSQQEFAGAQAFDHVDTYLAPFIHFDKLKYKDVKQGIQRLVYNLNFPLRSSYQTPFTNFTFDLKISEELGNKNVILNGQEMKFKYKEFQDEADLVNRAFLEVMLEGDANSLPFTFPIPTYNVTSKFSWNSDNANLIFELVAKFGLPYFLNCLNSDNNENDIKAMCCRLQLNKNHHPQGLWNFDANTGSIGVVSLNMSQLGYLGKNDEELFNRLDNLLNLTFEQLHFKREKVSEALNSGLLPFTAQYLDSFDSFFETVGIIGMHEFCFEGKTKALTSMNENKKLKNIKIGDKLIAYDERGDFVQTTVIKTSNRTILNYLELTFENGGKLKVTKEHPFWKSNFGWVSAENLVVGDEIFATTTHDAQSVKHRMKRPEERTRHSLAMAGEKNPMFGKVGPKHPKYGKKETIETRHAKSLAKIGENNPMKQPKNALKVSNTHKRKIKSGEIDVSKQLEAMHKKTRAIFADTQLREKRLKSWFSHLNKKPNGLEKRVIQFVSDLPINYVGNGKLWISANNKSRNPDFKVEGQKKVIEVTARGVREFFSYGQTTTDTYKSESIKFYDKAGYKCLILIFPDDEETARKQIQEFIHNGLKITKIEEKKTEIIVYNIDCKPFHNYFVCTKPNKSSDAVLVHNCMNYYGAPITDCQSEVLRILEYINTAISAESGENILMNFEATPAESAVYYLAKNDKKKFGNKIYASGKDVFYYSNSSNIPVDFDIDLISRLEFEEPFQIQYTGGTVMHIFHGQHMNGNQAKQIIRRVCENTKLPYVDLTPTYSICKRDKKKFNGTVEYCPECNNKTEVYSRVTGYYRPINKWNSGKQEEFKNRTDFLSSG